MIDEYKNIKTPYELLEFMEYYINYGVITKDNKIYKDPTSKEWSDNWFSNGIVQTGDEVLKSTYGTCWDQVELERKWFDEHNYKNKSFFLYFDLPYENNTSTHTVLVYEENNKYYLFENSWSGSEGITEFNSYNEAIKDIRNRLYEYNLEINPEYDLSKDDLKVFEYDKLTDSISVKEYLDYVINEEKELKIEK